jgi:acyl-CoA synthetase (AMP-forming)/AMP-acid ligase II
MLEVLFGVVKAGACVVPLSGLLTGEQLATLLEDSGSIGMFATATSARGSTRCARRWHRLRADLTVAVHGDHPGWIGYASFIEAFAAHATGGPPRAHRRLQHHLQLGHHRAAQGYRPDASRAAALGILQRGRDADIGSRAGTHDHLALFQRHVADDVAGAVRRRHAGRDARPSTRGRSSRPWPASGSRSTFMVPSQFLMVLAEPALDGADLASLETMLCAGSPLRRDTKREVIERMGNRLIELYGFSEGFATMLKPHHPADKFETVGIPVSVSRCASSTTRGVQLPRGETGEICGYGAGNMKGYHGRPAETAELIWRDERGRSFIRSGDIGRLDADGFLSIVDRKKDMIISGGFNVFPTDIEAVIGMHPEVLDVTVIGMPHEKWGETPVALAIPRPGSAPDPEAVMAWANERLARYQRVSAATLRSEFPRNALGKVLKRLLRDELKTSG